MEKFIKKRDFSEIMSETFNFFIKEFKPLAKILLVFIGPLILVNAYILHRSQATIQLWVENFIKTQNYENFPQDYLFLFLIIIIQNIVLVTVISSYMKLRIRDDNSEINLSSIWKLTSESILNVTLGQILVFLAVFVGSFIIALSGNLAISFLLIMIWAIYVVVSSYLLTFIIVFEKKNVFEALTRTLFVVKKNRWHVFGAVIVFGIMVGLSNLLLSYIIKSLISIISTGAAASALVTVLSELVSLALSALIAILPAFLYASFVAQKENPDLLEKISQIDSDNSNDNSEIS